MFLGINSLQKEAANSKTSKALAQLQKEEAGAFDFSQLWVFWEKFNKEAVDTALGVAHDVLLVEKKLLSWVS